MAYKHQMHPTVSKAEIALFVALSNEGLTCGMVTQQPIILKATIPDFCWNEKRKAVYLDGDAVHKEGDKWDAEVKELLELKGWAVRRIRYSAPITQTRLHEIVQEIREFLCMEAEP